MHTSCEVKYNKSLNMKVKITVCGTVQEISELLHTIISVPSGPRLLYAIILTYTAACLDENQDTKLPRQVIKLLRRLCTCTCH